MIKFSIKCFHSDESLNLMEAFEMVPLPLLEFACVTFQCPECGHEVILKMEVEKELKK